MIQLFKGLVFWQSERKTNAVMNRKPARPLPSNNAGILTPSDGENQSTVSWQRRQDFINP